MIPNKERCVPGKKGIGGTTAQKRNRERAGVFKVARGTAGGSTGEAKTGGDKWPKPP